MFEVEKTALGHLVQPPPSSSTATQKLARTESRWLSNTSKEGESTTPLSNQCQCSVTCAVMKCFMMFRQNLLSFSLCPLPLVLSLVQPPFRYIDWCIYKPYQLYTLISGWRAAQQKGVWECCLTAGSSQTGGVSWQPRGQTACWGASNPA